MKTLIVAMLLAANAHAATAPETTRSLNCHFTEPFFELQIDLVKRTIMKRFYDEGDYKTTLVASGIRMKSASHDPFLPIFQIKSADGRDFAVLKLDFAGNDGMSDDRFPYSIVMGRHHGGCTSNVMSKIIQAP